jgi:hypothetical protein
MQNPYAPSEIVQAELVKQPRNLTPWMAGLAGFAACAVIVLVIAMNRREPEPWWQDDPIVSSEELQKSIDDAIRRTYPTKEDAEKGLKEKVFSSDGRE